MLMSKWTWLQTNWDSMLAVLVALGTAAEGTIRLIPTTSDIGALSRLGALVDKFLAWAPNLKKKS